MSSQQELKVLGFVPEVGSKSFNLATRTYSSAKGYVPTSLQPTVSKLEEQVVSLSAPYVALAQDKSTELLKVVDNKVDSAVQSATTVYQSNTAYLQQQIEKQKQFHASNVESYKAAREQYLKKVEESVDFLKQNGLSGAAKLAADEVSTRVTKARELPSYLIKQVHDSFEKLIALEPVHRAVETVKPAVDSAFTTYMGVHDSVVATPQYQRVYSLGQTILSRAQESFVYRKAKENLYPVVAPYADPALEKVASSTYYKAALEHITPASA